VRTESEIIALVVRALHGSTVESIRNWKVKFLKISLLRKVAMDEHSH